MTFKTINFPLILRMTGFALVTGSTAVFLYLQKWEVVILCCILLIYSFSNLIRYINGRNRQLAYFLDAIRNEDTTLSFPETVKDNSLAKLHQSLNRLNKMISEIKIKNEYNEKFFRELIKYSATGLLAVDEDGYIDLKNNSAIKILGLPNISHINLLQQKNKQLYQNLMEAKPGESRTVKLLEGAELRLLSIKVASLKFGEKNYKIFSIYDIKTEMEENELDSWQKLIRVLTHEIMNSIAPITSLSNTLNSYFTKNGKPASVRAISQQDIENTVQGLSVIEERGKGLLQFVDDYRKLTKIPKPEFHTIILKDWLSKICLLMERRIREDEIRLEIVQKQKVKEFIGDEKLLSLVIINLLNNAIDALNETVEKQIHLVIDQNEAGRLVIEITDNGAGISSEHLERIFVPFYTTKETGSGIGLSLSRQIMRMHKGSIAVRSVSEKYTTFTLTF